MKDRLPSAQGDLPRVQGDVPSLKGGLPRAEGMSLHAKGSLPSAEGKLPCAKGKLPRDEGKPVHARTRSCFGNGRSMTTRRSPACGWARLEVGPIACRRPLSRKVSIPKHA